MTLQYVIDAQQRCIFMRLSGVIEDWSLGTGVQQLWEEEKFDPSFARFYDALDVSQWNAEPSLIRAIGGDVRVKSPRQVALVARLQLVLDEFLVYAESLQGIPTRIFNEREDAVEWLGVRLPHPWPPLHQVNED